MKDTNNIYLAKKMMEFLHEGQYRNDNITKYSEHPLAVYNRLIKWGVNEQFSSCSEYYLIAALLHDVLEEAKDYIAREKMCDMIKNSFGNFVLNLVLDLSFFPEQNTENKFAKAGYLVKCLDNEPTLLIKTADRICNTIDFFNINKRYAKYYFHKADCLYDKIYCIKTSDLVYDNIWNDIICIDKLLSYI